MSFFIRNKKGGPNISNARNGKKRKFSEKPKVSKKRINKALEEELTSEEDDDEGIEYDAGDIMEEEDDDVDDQLTEQERKVQLAKKYLEEIEQVERDREHDGNDNNVLKKLESGVLEKEGKLKFSIADNILKAEVVCTKFSGKPHRSSITSVCVTSTCKFVYSSCKDGIINKWSLESKTKLCSTPYNKKDKKSHWPIFCIALSSDDKYIASGDSQGNVKLWNENLEFIYTFLGHRAGITGLAFSIECDMLYSSSIDRSVKVWNVEDRAYTETLFGHQSAITSLDVLCKGRVLSSGGFDKTVRVWKIQEESQLVFNGHSRSIDMVKRLNDQQFVSCGDDGTLSLWSLLKKVPTHTIPAAHGQDILSTEPNWITAIASFPNSDLIASGSYDGFVKLWKVTPRRSLEFLFDISIDGVINSLAFTSDKKHIIVGVGKEHRFGRWKTIKEAKNTIAIIDIEFSKKN